jgi:hypothetical protein
MHTPEKVRQHSVLISPQSVDGTLSKDGLDYVLEHFKSPDDPFVVVHWNLSALYDAFVAYTGGQIPVGPPGPPLNIDCTDPE